MQEKDWVTRILEWCERVLPGLAAAFGIGHRVGSAGKAKVEKDLVKTKTELELTKNALQNEKDFDGKSDDDVIGDAIRKGRDSGKPPSG